MFEDDGLWTKLDFVPAASKTSFHSQTSNCQSCNINFSKRLKFIITKIQVDSGISKSTCKLLNIKTNVCQAQTSDTKSVQSFRRNRITLPSELQCRFNIF